MKKLVSILLVLTMVLSGMAAFAEEKTEYDVRVLVWKYDDTYGSSVRQAMDKWAKLVGEELGVTINLTMYDAADDMAKQVEQANQIVGQNPDFVIINLAEVASGKVLTDLFTGAGIPFLFYNKPPTEETYNEVVAETGSFFVGTLAREAGDMQGEILYDLYSANPEAIDLNGDGVIQFVEFEGEPNNAEAIARTKYSEETARDLGLDLEMVTDIIVANWDSTQANDRMLATWSSHPEIEVVFANNDDMATGVIAALNQSGYNTGNEGDPAITIIGVDATDAALEAIKAGRMTATVKQDGDAMGEANIRFMMNYLLNGSWMEGLEDRSTLNEDGVSVFIPSAKITQENAG